MGIEFNLAGGFIWILNFVLIYLLQTMANIGSKRSRSISGWISAMVALFILFNANSSLVINIDTITVIVIALIVIFAILLIIAPALAPQLNLNKFISPIIKFLNDVGIVIGFIMGFILAFFA